MSRFWWTVVTSNSCSLLYTIFGGTQTNTGDFRAHREFRGVLYSWPQTEHYYGNSTTFAKLMKIQSDTRASGSVCHHSAGITH